MTNLLAQIAITLLVATNWTGIAHNNQEMGYTVTNHVLSGTYQGKPFSFVLLSEPGSVAVWRPYSPPPHYATNWWIPGPSIFVTNLPLTMNAVLDVNASKP